MLLSPTGAPPGPSATKLVVPPGNPASVPAVQRPTGLVHPLVEKRASMLANTSKQRCAVSCATTLGASVSKTSTPDIVAIALVMILIASPLRRGLGSRRRAPHRCDVACARA